MSKHSNRHPASVATNPAKAPTSTPLLPSTTPNRHFPPTADEVRLRAYQKWVSAGAPEGDGVQFWLEAEHELSNVA